MPNCFHMVPIGATEPEPLNTIDRKMCEHFGVPVHPERYYREWYNAIGLPIALKGHHLGTPELRDTLRDWYDEEYLNEDIWPVLEWLEAHYTSDAWVER